MSKVIYNYRFKGCGIVGLIYEIDRPLENCTVGYLKSKWPEIAQSEGMNMTTHKLVSINIEMEVK